MSGRNAGGGATQERLPEASACPTISHPSNKQNQKGFSLLEMAIAVLILIIIAAIAKPNIAFTDPTKLDTAAREIAEAIRFARTESIRTQIPCGIYTDAAIEQIRVYRLPAATPVYDIYHPIDKKPYDIQLKMDPYVAGVDLVSASFSFAGAASSLYYMSFNTEGYPKITNAGTDYMLTGGTITLSHQGQQRIISIAPMTGRVTIQ